MHTSYGSLSITVVVVNVLVPNVSSVMD